MKICLDTNAKYLSYEINGKKYNVHLYSKEAFEIISQQWLSVGWDQKYSYTFTWLGRPIIQLPEDMIRTQEAIFRLKPDIIIETGVAHGGSLIFYASLCKLMNKGMVIGVDIEIRPHNRRAIESHDLSDYITLIEGNSIADDVIHQIASSIDPKDTVMVFLDSCHSRDHVYNELEAYHTFVSPNSYIVATDGIMGELFDVPNGNAAWKWDNPVEAVKLFLDQHQEFKIDTPSWEFNESTLDRNITYWPHAWLRKIS